MLSACQQLPSNVFCKRMDYQNLTFRLKLFNSMPVSIFIYFLVAWTETYLGMIIFLTDCLLLKQFYFSLDQLNCGSQPLLLAGYEDGSVVLWNLSMGKVLSQLVCHQEPVMSLDFDSEKAKGISGSSEKVLSIWSLNEQQNLQVRITGPLVSFIPLCTNSLID